MDRHAAARAQVAGQSSRWRCRGSRSAPMLVRRVCTERRTSRDDRRDPFAQHRQLAGLGRAAPHARACRRSSPGRPCPGRSRRASPGPGGAAPRRSRSRGRPGTARRCRGGRRWSEPAHQLADPGPRRRVRAGGRDAGRRTPATTAATPASVLSGNAKTWPCGLAVRPPRPRRRCPRTRRGWPGTRRLVTRGVRASPRGMWITSADTGSSSRTALSDLAAQRDRVEAVARACRTARSARGSAPARRGRARCGSRRLVEGGVHERADQAEAEAGHAPGERTAPARVLSVRRQDTIETTTTASSADRASATP